MPKCLGRKGISDEIYSSNIISAETSGKKGISTENSGKKRIAAKPKPKSTSTTRSQEAACVPIVQLEVD